MQRLNRLNRRLASLNASGAIGSSSGGGGGDPHPGNDLLLEDSGDKLLLETGSSNTLLLEG